MIRVRRIVLWTLSTISVLVLLFSYHTSTSGATGTGSSYVAGPSTSTSGAAGGSGSAGSAGTSGSGGAGKSGRTVAGDVASTQWGPVQVQLTVRGHKITGVDVLQHPSGSSTDQQINDYALPILVQETTDAQSAQIDMVSGATVTSDGYVQSLQSALDRAGL